MKKIISVILALIAIGQLTVTSAFFDSNEISLEEYSSQLSDLNKTYGIDSIGSINNNSNQIQKSLNRIIVKTNDNNPLEEDCGAIAKVEGYDCLHIMQYTSQKIAEQAFEYYSNLSSVEYVEFDFFFQISEPEFDQKIDYGDYGNDNDYLSWGSSTVNSNKAVAYANSLAEAPEIIVAVIDTGIDEKHSFFEDRIIDSEVDLIENDGNPYDDHVKGHGTHVAGIIVDNTAKNVKVSAYKTHDSQGWGNYSLTCMAIDLAVEDKVNVINMSCGWENTENCYNLFEDKIENAVGNNICVVVSAGNNGIDASQQCPASNSNVITVSSITNKNKPSEFSNFGVCVDIAAPGSNINSTLPNNSFGERNGTSMAAPFVAAAAAFMKTIKDYYPSNIERIIKETAFVPDGWDSRYGIGIISFANIMSRLSSSPPMLSFNENYDVVITSSSPDSTIYYTTDGSEPIVGVSDIYKNPIDSKSAISIRAIAAEEGKPPSAIATLKIKWSEDITVRYKGTVDLPIPNSKGIKSIYSLHEDIALVNKDDRSIYGASKGETTVTANLETGQKITYNVTVYYENWQLFIIYFLFGFLWYI